MAFTDRTHWRSRRKEHSLKLILALGDAVGLALGMAATRRST
jgi:hypothetical protein